MCKSHLLTTKGIDQRYWMCRSQPRGANNVSASAHCRSGATLLHRNTKWKRMYCATSQRNALEMIALRSLSKKCAMSLRGGPDTVVPLVFGKL